MKYFYDTEFIEDGKTVDLISIGIVREDGREYYAVNADLPERRIRKHEWLMANVVPHLPQGSGDRRNPIPATWVVDYHDPLVKPKTQIRDEVAAFLLQDGPPELFAWFASYDHVVLAQLFGTMMDFPDGVPMYTHDLRSLIDWFPPAHLPRQAAGLHNALEDARHLKAMYEAFEASLPRLI